MASKSEHHIFEGKRTKNAKHKSSTYIKYVENWYVKKKNKSDIKEKEVLQKQISCLNAVFCEISLLLII